MDQGGKQRQLLLHSMGIGGDEIPQGRRDLKCFCVLLDPLLPVLCPNGKDIGNEIQILNACKVLIQIRVIRDVGNLALAGKGVFPYILSANLYGPGIKVLNAGDTFECGRFPCTIVANKSVNIPRRNVQAQVCDPLAASFIMFRQMFHL